MWQPFLRSLSSWKRGAGIHPWSGGGAPRVWAMRCRGGSRTAPDGSRGCPLSRGGYGAGSYHRVATIPAKAGIHPWSGGGAPRVWAMRCRGGSRTAPTEAAVVPAQGVVTARAATIVWQPFLRSLSSWKRGAGIHPWSGGGAPRVWAMRCRGGSRTAPDGSRGCPLSRGGYGAGSYHRVATIPAKAGIYPWSGGGAPRVWAMRCRGGSRTAPDGSRGCPCSRGGYGAGSYHRVATIPAKAGIHPLARARRGSTVFPAKLVLVETGSRNPSPPSPKFPL